MPKQANGIPSFVHALRNDLRSKLVAAFGQAVDSALADVFGGSVSSSTQTPAPRARSGRPVGSKNRPKVAGRKEVASYNPTSPKARRLPSFMLTLLGGSVEKKVLAQRYGNFTFTGETTKAEAEAQAKKIAESRSPAPESKAGVVKARKARGKKSRAEPTAAAEA